MVKEANKPLNWTDTLARVLVPGILIAFAGFIGQWAMTTYSSKQENARLVTNLQIQREQAESVLRKDTFDHAISALLSDEAGVSEISVLSKRLLKLELLSLNFGDSLSLSPFFTEFERDIKMAERSNGNELDDNEQIRIMVLRKRLRSLAKRVASTQTSSLVQHGVEKPIKVKLTENGYNLANGKKEYKWPLDQVYSELKGTDSTAEDILSFAKGLSEIELEGQKRHMLVTVSGPDPSEMKVKVDLEICSPDQVLDTGNCDCQHHDTICRPFTLDLFNFPKIDNTRLSSNQRVSLVLDDFFVANSLTAGRDNRGSELEIRAIFFPSEYASLRERPSMEEALKLLERAQEHPHDQDSSQ